MSEQKTACEAILKSLKEDLAKKGSRKKRLTIGNLLLVPRLVSKKWVLLDGK